jgi:hypothetical protein
MLSGNPTYIGRFKALALGINAALGLIVLNPSNQTVGKAMPLVADNPQEAKEAAVSILITFGGYIPEPIFPRSN